MTKKLSDSREMTIEDADRLMQEIANQEIEVVRIAAKFEKRLNALKAECEAETLPYANAIRSRMESLSQFIGNNPDKFIKPRARVTPFGKYGKRTVSSIEVDDPAALIAWAKLNELPLIVEKFVVDKNAVKAYIEADDLKHSVPGARLVSGEETFYKVEKKLLDTARENILSN